MFSVKRSWDKESKTHPASARLGDFEQESDLWALVSLFQTSNCIFSLTEFSSFAAII